MAIGIGLHCWYCEHGPCNGECRDKIDSSVFVKNTKKQKKKLKKIVKISLNGK